MAISNLTPVEEWPTRKLPQDRFDDAVKTAMDQMSVMVNELNSNFIPRTNEAIDTINDISTDLPTILDSPNQAAAAAASAQQAATSASQAGQSASAASNSAQNASNSAATATSKATEAGQSASAASTSALDASNSANTATSKATEAAQSASAASNSAQNAESSASAASSSAQQAAGSASTAASEANRAKEEADRAASVVSVDIATTDKAGIVKPDGTTTTITPDGTLTVPTFTGSSVGLVPQAGTAVADKMLHGDGTWKELPVFSGSANGLVPSSGATAGKVLQGDGTWDNTGLVPISEKSQALGNVSGSRAINLSSGLFISATITGDTAFSFTNTPTDAVVVVLQLTNGGSYTTTWPTSIKWAGGTAPKLTASGVDIIVLTTNNSGSRWYGIANLEYA